MPEKVIKSDLGELAVYAVK